MLENINLELHRVRLHGADSSLFILKEHDTQWDALIEILSDFSLTRQRDVAEGGMVDVLTVRLKTDEQKTHFNRGDAILLRMGLTRYKYAIENKEFVPTQNGLIAYANARAIFNDTATVVSIEEP